MNRLDFKLPEFTRVVWASAKYRESWEGKIRDISAAWLHIEQSTIGAIRPGGLQSVKPEDLLTFQAYCHHAQNEFAIIQQEGMSPVYGNASTPVIKGKPWAYRVYAGKDPKGFLLAWQGNDQRKIGQMLGYPICCTEFFLKYWVGQGWRDLTVPMVQNGPESGPFNSNILLRHLGIRPVFHLPCSFNCVETSMVSHAIIKHGCRLGYGIEMGWLKEILEWPIKWTSLHGVAITTTPALKIIYSTDALPTEVTFERAQKVSMLDGIRDTWSDNGFSSYTSMVRAHDLVVNSVARILLDSGRILDLGCGNGLLLERITKACEFLVPYGIESNPKRAQRAKERLGSNIIQGDIFETYDILDWDYQVVLISLNRFKEAAVGEADFLLRRLRERTKYLVVYSYEPWDSDWDFPHFTVVDTHKKENFELRICRPR